MTCTAQNCPVTHTIIYTHRMTLIGVFLTLWLRLADTSVKKLVYLARIADKLAHLIRMLWHRWPINWPAWFEDVAQMVDKSTSGLPTFERQNLMFIYTKFSIYEWKLNILIFRFKNCVYILAMCYGWGGASILSTRNMSTKEKSPCQTLNMEKNLRARWRYVKNHLCVQEMVAKKHNCLLNWISWKNT